jgi:hypothetical protein
MPPDADSWRNLNNKETFLYFLPTNQVNRLLIQSQLHCLTQSLNTVVTVIAITLQTVFHHVARVQFDLSSSLGNWDGTLARLDNRDVIQVGSFGRWWPPCNPAGASIDLPEFQAPAPQIDKIREQPAGRHVRCQRRTHDDQTEQDPRGRRRQGDPVHGRRPNSMLLDTARIKLNEPRALGN